MSGPTIILFLTAAVVLVFIGIDMMKGKCWAGIPTVLCGVGLAVLPIVVNAVVNLPA